MNPIDSLATCIHKRQPTGREYLLKGHQPEHRARFAQFFANRGSTEFAKGSVQQASCEERARSSPFRPIPRQYRRRGRLALLHRTPGLEGQITPLSRESMQVRFAEGSNQKDRPPIQYTEIPTEAQTSHIVWQREQGYDQRPLQQSDEPTLACTNTARRFTA